MLSREGAGAAVLRRARLAVFLPGSTHAAGELVSCLGRLEVAAIGRLEVNARRRTRFARTHAIRVREGRRRSSADEWGSRRRLSVEYGEEGGN
jgi:hypothetical protein